MQAALRVAEWDGIRVPRHVGLTMLHHLSKVSPPVIVDPAERTLYFLVPIGSADHWQLPERQVADIRRRLILPPAQQQMPPGRYWLLLPTVSAQRAAVRSLRAALERIWRASPTSGEGAPGTVSIGLEVRDVREDRHGRSPHFSGPLIRKDLLTHAEA
jgi:hypothetical protein